MTKTLSWNPTQFGLSNFEKLQQAHKRLSFWKKNPNRGFRKINSSWTPYCKMAAKSVKFTNVILVGELEKLPYWKFADGFIVVYIPNERYPLQNTLHSYLLCLEHAPKWDFSFDYTKLIK